MTTKEQRNAHLEELDNLIAQLDQVIQQRQHAQDRQHIQRRRAAVAWATDIARQRTTVSVHPSSDGGRHLKVVVNDGGSSQDAS